MRHAVHEPHNYVQPTPQTSRGYDARIPRMRFRNKTPDGLPREEYQIMVEFGYIPLCCMTIWEEVGAPHRTGRRRRRPTMTRLRTSVVFGSLGYGYFRAVTVKRGTNMPKQIGRVFHFIPKIPLKMLALDWKSRETQNEKDTTHRTAAFVNESQFQRRQG
jgi:hypothetical protein